VTAFFNLFLEKLLIDESSAPLDGSEAGTGGGAGAGGGGGPGGGGGGGPASSLMVATGMLAREQQLVCAKGSLIAHASAYMKPLKLVTFDFLGTLGRFRAPVFEVYAAIGLV
jgi:hypothetical protein